MGETLRWSFTRIKISVNMIILVFVFYGYIRNIGEISVDILTKILMKRK